MAEKTRPFSESKPESGKPVDITKPTAEPIPVTIVPPLPVAPPAVPDPEPVDPDKKTPENQINVPPPPPLDPVKRRFPSDAVPIGEEHRTPAAQQQAAEAAFQGITVEELVTGEKSESGKKGGK